MINKTFEYIISDRGGFDTVSDELRRASREPGFSGAVVRIAPGTYVLDKPWLVADAGGAPVLYESAGSPGSVRILGGKPLTGFAPLSADDTAAPVVESRFRPEVRAHILRCDLRANGVDDLGKFVSRGFGRSRDYTYNDFPAHLELFLDGEPMTVAQYPDKGRWLRIAEGTEGPLDKGFFYDGDRPLSWRDDPDIWVHGFWEWDWADTYEHVAAIDKQRRHVMNSPPYGAYSFKPGKRFCFFNVPEELDAPGEYYVDQRSGMLYFYPDRTLTPDAEIWASTLTEPVVRQSGASNVTLRGITVEGGRADGIRADDCRGLTIDSCVVRNTGKWGVFIKGGKNLRVTGCDIFNTGDGGVLIMAGDRVTLESAEAEVSNCDIHHIGRWAMAYLTAVNFMGVGLRVAHNLIHDCPHTGIRYHANDLLIEYNEFYNIDMLTADVGIIDSGGDFTYSGIVIRNNYMHHVGGFPEIPRMTIGVYNDAAMSGVDVYDNFFYEIPVGISLSGGRALTVRNNVFSHVNQILYKSAYATHPKERDGVDGLMKRAFYELRANEPPYVTRYPHLADIHRYYAEAGDGPALIPGDGVVEHNVAESGADVVWEKVHWTYKDGEYRETGNIITADPGFVDPDFGIIELRDDSPVLATGHRKVSMAPIGLTGTPRATPVPVVSSSLKCLSSGHFRLTLRNDGNLPASGSMRIFDTYCLPLEFEGNYFRFDMLPPGGIVSFDFDISDIATRENTALYAMSPDSGIRPARYKPDLAV